MEIPIFQVDAFTNRVFAGNPAAVCPLPFWPPESLLQAIAAENNLSETAFFVPGEEPLRIRWFTPASEIDLCGHATLASAFVLFQEFEEYRDAVFFTSQSGELGVTQDGDRLSMDFPSWEAEPTALDEALIQAMGPGAPLEAFTSRDMMLVYGSEAEVAALSPDMGVLSGMGKHGFIATAPGDEVDFVSRFFAPAYGIPEDPVTGRAHSTLIPFWGRRLGKKSMRAWQISKRRGELWCEHVGGRALISGQAVMYMKGMIEVDLPH